MLKVCYKIYKKRRGYWRPRLEFHRIYEESEALSLRPKLVFQKEYQLPGPIYLGPDCEAEGNEGCRQIKSLFIRIDSYVDRPNKLHIRPSLHAHTCISTCPGCKAYLPWRPKVDYSDYIAVFDQVAKDLIEAWNKAVEEAFASEEGEEIEAIYTPETFTIFSAQKLYSKQKNVKKNNNIIKKGVKN